MLGRNARTAVAHTDPDATAIALDREHHRTARSVSDSVRSQVEEDMPRAIGIAQGEDGGVRCSLGDPQAFTERHRFRDFADLVDHGREIERRARQRDLAILATRNEQQLFHEFGGPVELVLDGGERVLHLRLGATVLLRPLHLRPQMRERCAQLVARIGGEGLQRPVRAIDALEHAVDAVGERRDFGLPGRTGKAGAQFGWADRARFAGHALERLQRRADRLTRGPGGGERRQRKQQGGGGHKNAERDEVGLPAPDDVRIELSHRSVQHAIAPACALRDGGHELVSRPFQAARRHSGREVVELRHPAGVGRGPGNQNLVAHPDDLIGQGGGHHAFRRAGRVTIRAEQRLDDVGGALQGAAQRRLGGRGEQQHHDHGVPGERRPGHTPEAAREHITEPALRHRSPRQPPSGIPRRAPCGSGRIVRQNSASCGGN